jgi:predicted RNA-binding protein YlqC (UPF0109 family)
MKDLLSYMLENIVDGPIEVTEENDNGFIVFKVSAPQDQVGMIIGKGGKIINALKNILKIRAIKEQIRVDIQIEEA